MLPVFFSIKRHCLERKIRSQSTIKLSSFSKNHNVTPLIALYLSVCSTLEHFNASHEEKHFTVDTKSWGKSHIMFPGSSY